MILKGSLCFKIKTDIFPLYAPHRMSFWTRFRGTHQGLASFCAKAPFQKSIDIIRGLYANLRQELLYSLNERGELFSFRTHDGTNVPLALRSPHGIVGIIPIEEDKIHRKALESARSFLAHHPKGKIVFAYTGKSAFTKDFSSFAIPYWWLI